jgi:hypothetical protein
MSDEPAKKALPTFIAKQKRPRPLILDIFAVFQNLNKNSNEYAVRLTFLCRQISFLAQFSNALIVLGHCPWTGMLYYEIRGRVVSTKR